MFVLSRNQALYGLTRAIAQEEHKPVINKDNTLIPLGKQEGAG